MRTELHADVLATDAGQRADEILRACVHCGFCNATCPTYQVLGDERDGPRGRIYLIKDMLEAGEPNLVASNHLDRCLTCRACETTCPSNVAYGELLEIGRGFIEPQLQRGPVERLKRRFLRSVLPFPRRFNRLTQPARWLRKLLPKRLAAQIPNRPLSKVARRERSEPVDVVLLQGCVQRQLTPSTDAALLQLCDDLGLQSAHAAEEGCCGALNLHLAAESVAHDQMRANAKAIDAALAPGGKVVSSASGCGVTIKDYARLLPNDAPAARVAQATVDATELLYGYRERLTATQPGKRIAVQTPCTLQHGQAQAGRIEALLTSAGYELVATSDGHLCCGSAGTYSVLQRDTSNELARRKLESLEAGSPDVIATANVGCQTHLLGRSSTPVVHWLELVRVSDAGDQPQRDAPL